jgi:hypothetical protein
MKLHICALQCKIVFIVLWDQDPHSAMRLWLGRLWLGRGSGWVGALVGSALVGSALVGSSFQRVFRDRVMKVTCGQFCL